MKSAPSNRLRLDEALVARGLYATRSRARDAIARGTVQVGGSAVTKPGLSVDPQADIVVADPAQSFVSRAALKLTAGLDAFSFSPEGETALDIGASTGGFVQVLLQRGAAHVVGVDVGHGQLHPSLAGDTRVSNLEGLNARDLSRSHLAGRRIGFVVSDVSFISLKLALPPALDLTEPGSRCVLLVKPQFEAGRAAIGKGGLLKDKALGRRIADDMFGWLDAQSGWRAVGVVRSPVEGGDGNLEYLLGGIKDR